MFLSRYLTGISAIMLMLMCLQQSEAMAQMEPSDEVTIAVLDLEVASGVSEAERRPLSDRLRQELFKTGKYTVVERNAMEDLLQEQGFQITGCTTTECAAEMGRLLGVQRIVAGSIGLVGETYTVNARMIEVASAKILISESVDCACPIDEVLKSSLREVARKLAGTERVEPVKKPDSTLATITPDKPPVPGKSVRVDRLNEQVLPALRSWIRPGDRRPDHYRYVAAKSSGNRFGVIIGSGDSNDLRWGFEYFGDGRKFYESHYDAEDEEWTSQTHPDVFVLTADRRFLEFWNIHFTPQLGVGFQVDSPGFVLRWSIFAWEFDINDRWSVRISPDQDRNIRTSKTEGSWSLQFSYIL